jgi:hypothetical protein
MFYNAFVSAGFKKSFMTEIENQYCNCEICAPWYDVDTEIGTIRIGWRKRVINIDWSRVVNSDGILSLFKKEDTTKDKNMIHAWGIEKATEYLGVIRKYMEEQQ